MGKQIRASMGEQWVRPMGVGGEGGGAGRVIRGRGGRGGGKGAWLTHSSAVPLVELNATYFPPAQLGTPWGGGKVVGGR